MTPKNDWNTSLRAAVREGARQGTRDFFSVWRWLLVRPARWLYQAIRRR